MTAPPLPASPCLRVRLDYVNNDQSLAGSRFYLSYAGAAPTAANCIAIADGVEAAWVTHLAPYVNSAWNLEEVDVLDIASLTGSSGQWTGVAAGGDSGTAVPSNCAVNCEFGIARRYRGGKPRMFLLPGSAGDLADAGHWSVTFSNNVQTAIAAFFTEIEALSVGAVGALAHVNLSYYAGFRNITNSSGRERAVPVYRDAALLDTVESYIVKRLVGSQRRRRNATTY